MTTSVSSVKGSTLVGRIVRWLPGLCAIALLAGIVYLLASVVQARQSSLPIHFFVPSSGEVLSWGQLIVLIIVMLLGLVAGHLFERLKKATGPVSILAELRGMTHNARFWMALLISPIIFMSVYILIRDRPSTIVDYLLAFQNGFWWETVLRQRDQGEAAGSSNT
jgi:hypothetical protein